MSKITQHGQTLFFIPQMGEKDLKLPTVVGKIIHRTQMGIHDHKLPMVRKNIYISQMGEIDDKLPAMLREKNLPASNG